MKLKFKHQKFQEDAAIAVCDVFAGQLYSTPSYLVDTGFDLLPLASSLEAIGFNNALVSIPESQVLSSIQAIQLRNSIKPSSSLEGRYNLTIEMETGERVIIVTGCINALRSRVSGTLVNMIHALLRVIKYNYCKQCMRSKDVLALQY